LTVLLSHEALNTLCLLTVERNKHFKLFSQRNDDKNMQIQTWLQNQNISFFPYNQATDRPTDQPTNQPINCMKQTLSGESSLPFSQGTTTGSYTEPDAATPHCLALFP
jgi:hypothetical protein